MENWKVKVRLNKIQLHQFTSDRLGRKVLEQLVNQVRMRIVIVPVQFPLDHCQSDKMTIEKVRTNFSYAPEFETTKHP